MNPSTLILQKCFVSTNKDMNILHSLPKTTREELAKKLEQTLQFEPYIQKTHTGDNLNVMGIK
jgi:hypothetical protein